MRLYLTAALLLLLLAACGGDATYALEPTRACLEEAGLPASTDEDDLDYVAMGAGIGAIYSNFQENTVTVILERSGADAEDTATGYTMFGVDGEKVRRNGNALLVWDKTPTDAERNRIEGCLSD